MEVATPFAALVMVVTLATKRAKFVRPAGASQTLLFVSPVETIAIDPPAVVDALAVKTVEFTSEAVGTTVSNVAVLVAGVLDANPSPHVSQTLTVPSTSPAV